MIVTASIVGLTLVCIGLVLEIVELRVRAARLEAEALAFRAGIEAANEALSDLRWSISYNTGNLAIRANGHEDRLRMLEGGRA